ncbi:hypothetical protein N656DRAFT_67537 [Canariomyces notabilis]|uniref:Secreted protein n=1 Tax=Canariomyces notabilis TaxID=2074819 RepID=A0AAN6TPN4_9PEZI|nr:hypothetical protein N656DRAFT_67537 [Canariomyces arenarius]
MREWTLLWCSSTCMVSWQVNGLALVANRLRCYLAKVSPVVLNDAPVTAVSHRARWEVVHDQVCSRLCLWIGRSGSKPK